MGWTGGDEAERMGKSIADKANQRKTASEFSDGEILSGVEVEGKGHILDWTEH